MPVSKVQVYNEVCDQLFHISTFLQIYDVPIQAVDV